jgi:hypothetical protein
MGSVVGEKQSKMGDMNTLAASFTTVAFSGAFDNLMWCLHTCSTTCEEPCGKKARVVGFVGLVTETCRETFAKLSEPSVSNVVKVVSNLAFSLWHEFNLAEEPIDYSGYTPRNKLIHAAMYEQAKARFEAEAGFSGWK